LGEREKLTYYQSGKKEVLKLLYATILNFKSDEKAKYNDGCGGVL